MDIMISVIAAVALFALLKFALKRPASFAITAAAFVLIMLNISEIKPVLETVGKSIGTNTVLGISAILMLVLLFLKVPVFISVFCASMLYFIFNPGINQIVFGQKGVLGTESASLLAIPFFVCAGVFMN